MSEHLAEGQLIVIIEDNQQDEFKKFLESNNLKVLQELGSIDLVLVEVPVGQEIAFRDRFNEAGFIADCSYKRRLSSKPIGGREAF